MGIVDYPELHKVYRKCVDYCKKQKIPFNFKVDSGSWETAIEFTAIGYHHPPRSKSWEEVEKQGNEIKCPDILEYNHKIIIEWEEEHGSQKSGARLAKKGHSHKGDIDTNRDVDRNMLYRIAGFRLLRLYESDKDWNKQLESFLTKCHNQNITLKYVK